MKKYKTGGMNNPNPKATVAKKATSRVGGGNGNVKRVTNPTKYTGGKNAPAKVSPKGGK